MNTKSAQELVVEELNFRELLRLYYSNWKVFAFIGITLSILGLFAYTYKDSFVATSTIVVNDSQNSALQSFSTQFAGITKTLQESKKGSSLLSKHIEYLRSRGFLESLLEFITERGEGVDVTVDERKGFEIFKKEYLGRDKTADELSDILQVLDRCLKVQQDSEFEIKFQVYSQDKYLSVFIVNAAAELAVKKLRQLEFKEIKSVEEFLADQKNEANKNINLLEMEMASLQKKDQLIIPVGAQDKIGSYASELLIRANELKLKISENMQLISYLEQGRSDEKDSSLHGLGGRIESLRIENSLLKSRLLQVQQSLDHFKKEVQGIPLVLQKADDLKRKTELEFGRYKDLTAALLRLEAQRVSINNRYEIFDRARRENTQVQISFSAILLIVLVMTQLLGSLFIYFRYLLHPQLQILSTKPMPIFASQLKRLQQDLEGNQNTKNPEPVHVEGNVNWAMASVDPRTEIKQ